MAVDIKETGDKLKEGIKNLKGEAEHYRHRAEEEMKDFREKLHVYREGASEFIDSMGTYVKENPQRSALIAAGFGFVAGMVTALLLQRGGRKE